MSVQTAHAAAKSLERPEVGAVMVIEIQENNHIALNHVDDHPIANVGAHHACQVMTEHLADEWIIADFRELVKDAIPQNMILLSESLKVLLKSGSEA
jgi:hypothetical protein